MSCEHVRPKVLRTCGIVDSQLESPAKVGAIKLGDVAAKLSVKLPAASAPWSWLSNAKPKLAVRPNGHADMSAEQPVKIEVEPLEWLFNGAATL